MRFGCLHVAVVVLFVASAAGAMPHRYHEVPFVAPAPHDGIVASNVHDELTPLPFADGCVSSPMTCNTSARGRLAVGDCTLSDGTYFDAFRFNGSAGQLITATVYPISSSMTNPTIALAPPSGDASKPPQLSGGKAASVQYVLASTGSWTLGVGTRDLFALGDYIVGLSCEPDPDPTEPQSCVYQDIVCGQTAAWYLTSQSCRFEDDPNRVYAAFTIYGVAGDLLSMELLSSAFQPLFAIYDSDKGGAPLATSTAASPTKDILSTYVPHDGYYDIVVTSNNSLGIGFFALTVNCTSSGCLPPLLVQQPADTVVPSGARATLNATAAGIGTLRYTWYDRSGLPSPVGIGSMFITPPVTARQTYSVTVTLPCGAAESRLVTVTPAAPARHRAARH